MLAFEPLDHRRLHALQILFKRLVLLPRWGLRLVLLQRMHHVLRDLLLEEVAREDALHHEVGREVSDLLARLRTLARHALARGLALQLLHRLQRVGHSARVHLDWLDQQRGRIWIRKVHLQRLVDVEGEGDGVLHERELRLHVLLACHDLRPHLVCEVAHLARVVVELLHVSLELRHLRLLADDLLVVTRLGVDQPRLHRLEVGLLLLDHARHLPDRLVHLRLGQIRRALLLHHLQPQLLVVLMQLRHLRGELPNHLLAFGDGGERRVVAFLLVLHHLLHFFHRLLQVSILLLNHVHPRLLCLQLLELCGESRHLRFESLVERLHILLVRLAQLGDLPAHRIVLFLDLVLE